MKRNILCATALFSVMLLIGTAIAVCFAEPAMATCIDEGMPASYCGGTCVPYEGEFTPIFLACCWAGPCDPNGPNSHPIWEVTKVCDGQWCWEVTGCWNGSSHIKTCP